MLRKLFSNSVIYGFSQQIVGVAGVLALPFITEHLTAADFGIWGIITAYTAAFEALATLGLNVVLVNAFYKMPNQFKWLWRQVYGFLMLWSVPYALVLAIIIYLVVPDAAADKRWLLMFLIVTPTVLFGPTSILGFYYYHLRQRAMPVAIRTAGFGLLTVALYLYTIVHMKMGFMGWAWTGFIVNMLTCLSYWYVVNKRSGMSPIFNFKWHRIRHSLRVGLPTIPHNYSSFLQRGGSRIIMERSGVSVSTLGEYNLAQTMGDFFSAMTSAMNMALSPMLAQTFKDENWPQARRLIFMFQVTVMAMTTVFCLWSKEIIDLLIRNDDLKSVYLLAIPIVMAYNHLPVYVAVVNKLMYDERTGQLWRISLMSGIINVVLGAVCIPVFGYEAAAPVFFVCMMYNGFYGHFAKGLKSTLGTDYLASRWFLSILILTIGVYFMVELHWSMKIVVTVGGMCAALWALWHFGKDIELDSRLEENEG